MDDSDWSMASLMPDSGDEAGPSRRATRSRSRQKAPYRSRPSRKSSNMDQSAYGEAEPVSATAPGPNLGADVETFRLNLSGSASSIQDQDDVHVSSPSLAKILHTRNIGPLPSSGMVKAASSSSVSSSPAGVLPSSSSSAPPPPPPPPGRRAQPEPLSEYTCPICFFPPTNATLTPCGHICCGSCLFTAVKSTMQRAAMMAREEADVPRCPVCRANIPGWDGRGGGVIGLKPRAVIAL